MKATKGIAHRSDQRLPEGDGPHTRRRHHAPSFGNYTTTFTFGEYPTLTIELAQKVGHGITPAISAQAGGGGAQECNG